MFRTGDFVVASSNGICEITDIVMMDMAGRGKESEYFVLVPLKDRHAKIYITVDQAEQKIREIITSAKAKKLLKSRDQVPEPSVENEKLREKEYRQIISDADPSEIAGLIKHIRLRNSERLSSGKKITSVDERYLSIAENFLCAELRLALKDDTIVAESLDF